MLNDGVIGGGGAKGVIFEYYRVGMFFFPNVAAVRMFDPESDLEKDLLHC